MGKNIEQDAEVPPHHMMYDANINNWNASSMN